MNPNPNSKRVLTWDEIELVKEGVCEGCKGVWWLHDSGCYEICEGFQEAVADDLALALAQAMEERKP